MIAVKADQTILDHKVSKLAGFFFLSSAEGGIWKGNLTPSCSGRLMR